MLVGAKFLRRALAVGVAAAAVLCVTFGLAVWQLAGSASRRQPGRQPGRVPGRFAQLNPPPVTFWERADLLLFRGRAARAGAKAVAGGGAAGPDAGAGVAAGAGPGAGAGLAAGAGLPAAPGPGAQRRAGALPEQAGAKRDPYRETAENDARELAEASSRLDLPAARRRELLDEYRRLRTEWLVQDARAAGQGAAPPGLLDLDPAGAAVPALPRTAPAVEPVLPPGLPVEFAEYLLGAFAFRRGDLAAAGGHWQRLLALPEQLRHYRSTWAAFMLGRAALCRSPRDLDAAVGWFQRTRELAAGGFADSLGLAVASLGWEARANAARRRYDRAEALYAQQADAGDPSGIDSLRILWRERLLHAVLGR
jgi:hypothetical protein